MSSFVAASAAAPLLHPLHLHRHLRRRSPPTHQRINCVPLAAILCEWPGSWGALGCVRGGSCGFQSIAASSTSTWHRTVERTRRDPRPRRPALRSRKKGEEGWLACHPCPFRRSFPRLAHRVVPQRERIVGLFRAAGLLPTLILHMPPPTAAVLSRGLVTHRGRGQQLMRAEFSTVASRLCASGGSAVDVMRPHDPVPSI